MHFRARTALSGLALLVVTACSGGDSTTPTPVVTGHWVGPFTTGTTAAQMDLTLTETSGTVSGNGTLTAATQAIAVSTTGTYSPPSISLSITAAGFNELNYSATVSDSTMTGTLNGSGFVATALTLHKR